MFSLTFRRTLFRRCDRIFQNRGKLNDSSNRETKEKRSKCCECVAAGVTGKIPSVVFGENENEKKQQKNSKERRRRGRKTKKKERKENNMIVDRDAMAMTEAHPPTSSAASSASSSSSSSSSSTAAAAAAAASAASAAAAAAVLTNYANFPFPFGLAGLSGGLAGQLNAKQSGAFILHFLFSFRQFCKQKPPAN